MGLFDAYDPATYQGTQGGLLDRILASVGATPTPSAGFPGSPAPPPVVASDDDDTPAAPAQASPIGVGGYQMPRIGPAAAFTPPAGTLDPNTGEHVVAPMQQPAAQPAPSPLNTIGSHLTAGYQNLHHGGGLIGSVVAAVTGKRNDQQAEALQQQQSAYGAMGFPPQVATAMTLNGEFAKTMIAQKFGPNTVQSLGEGWIYNPKTGKTERAYTPEQKDNFGIVQTGENGLGGKTFQKMNKATGDMTPIAGAPGADTGGGIGNITPQEDAVSQAMIEGRQAPPSSIALSKPYWQRMLAVANSKDPTFDQTQWSGRVAGARDFASGKSSEMVRSANQTLQHVNALLDSADALHNGNYPSMNWVGNKFNEATGGGEPGAFKTNAHAVADEMSKVFKGGNLSDSEIRAWEENLSPNMSPAQQRAQIGKLAELLHGSLQALDEKRVSSIGQVAADKAGPIIKPAGQAVLQRIDAWLKAGNAAASGGTAPTGVKWSVVQ